MIKQVKTAIMIPGWLLPTMAHVTNQLGASRF